MPKGIGRVRPESPLSPLVTDTQRNARPHSTCPRASVIIRKLMPDARSATRPNRAAISVVPARVSVLLAPE